MKPAQSNEEYSGANSAKTNGLPRNQEREVGFYDTLGIARGVAVSGSYAYVADDTYGLRIIDISNPATPTEAGFYDTPGTAYGVAVSGSYAYVADGTSGLRILDVSNPAAPTEAGFYDTPGTARGVAVSGSYAYVADDSIGPAHHRRLQPRRPHRGGLLQHAWDCL